MSLRIITVRASFGGFPALPERGLWDSSKNNILRSGGNGLETFSDTSGTGATVGINGGGTTTASGGDLIFGGAGDDVINVMAATDASAFVGGADIDASVTAASSWNAANFSALV